MLRVADTEHAQLPSASLISPPGENRLDERILSSLREFQDRADVSTGIPEPLLAEQFRGTAIPDAPREASAYFDFLIDVVVRHSPNTASARCLGHMTGGVPTLLQPLGSLLVGLNQNLVKSEASKTLGLLERQTLAMLHRLVYHGEETFYEEHVQRNGSTLGVVTTGGTLANLTALWCARNAVLPASADFGGVESDGLAAALRCHGYARAVILGSRLMHYSVEKAAGLLGLGTGGLIQIPVDGRNRIQLPALEAAIAECRRRRWCVIALVGVAGTTDCGSIDPLDALAGIAARERIPFHVDAAWGAPLLFSEEYRRLLAGIERADSVTIDGHKQLYLPVGLSMLLFRDHQAARVVEKQAAYMLHHDSSDLGKTSVEGSRSGIVLFAHAAFHLLGRRGYRGLIENNLRQAASLARMISASDEFELLCAPETNIVLYRHLPERWRAASASGSLLPADNEQLNAHNTALQRAQYGAGHSFVSRTTLSHLPRYPGIPIVALRAVVMNPATREEDLRAVLAEQASLAAAPGIAADLAAP